MQKSLKHCFVIIYITMKIVKIKLLSLFMAIVIAIQPAVAQELPNPEITPDSWMYGIKRFFETLDLMLTFDEVEKAKKYLKHAELRLAEAKKMAEEGKLEYIDDLMREYESNLNKSIKIIEKAQKAGKNVSKVAELVAIATTIHLDVLDFVYDIVPDQARAAIKMAKNVSLRGNEQALNVLEKIMPEKACKLHIKLAEKLLLKARKNAKRGEDVESLLKESQERINRSKEISRNYNLTSMAKLIDDVTHEHIDVLHEVHKTVPKVAQPAIEKAINVSIMKRSKSLTEITEIGSTKIPTKVPVNKTKGIPTEIPVKITKRK